MSATALTTSWRCCLSEFKPAPAGLSPIAEHVRFAPESRQITAPLHVRFVPKADSCHRSEVRVYSITCRRGRAADVDCLCCNLVNPHYERIGRFLASYEAINYLPVHHHQLTTHSNCQKSARPSRKR